MKYKYQIFFLVTIIIVIGGFIGYCLCQDNISNNGKQYPSKQSLCRHFAQSYLRTIPKTEPNYTGEKWGIAVAIETDLYNLCLLDLDKEVLKDYRTSTIEKLK